jgi:4'-phosphopantetheinyl transferase
MSTPYSSATRIVVRENHLAAADCDCAALTSGEIHIWRQALDLESPETDELRSVLSLDELERARRFRFDHDRSHFTVSRGTLRRLLGTYLRLAPANLRFVYSEYGRPILMPETTSIPIEFNVSHSAGYAIFAFAYRRRIGVDIEKLRRDFSTIEIAERFFSLTERSALRELPVELRHEAFFRCWTRKEAFIKALGEGLSHPLDQFDVSLVPNAPPELLATRPDAAEARNWGLWNVKVPDDYVAALAAEAVPPVG